jgi:hypothetical protein
MIRQAGGAWLFRPAALGENKLRKFMDAKNKIDQDIWRQNLITSGRRFPLNWFRAAITPLNISATLISARSLHDICRQHDF